MNQPRLQANGSCDFDEMTDLIHRLLKAAWGEKCGTFCEAFPNGMDPTDIKFPVITYSLVEMLPGQISNNGHREIKPRHRETFLDDANGAVDVMGRIFDCLVVFEVWEENNAKASAVAKDFRKFLDLYTGFIKSEGVKELTFDRYTRVPATEQQWRDNVSCRSLYYKVRLEELTEVHSGVIERVIGKVQATSDLSRGSNEKAITFVKGD